MECRVGAFLPPVPPGTRGTRAMVLAEVTNERGRDPRLPPSRPSSPCRGAAHAAGLLHGCWRQLLLPGILLRDPHRPGA